MSTVSNQSKIERENPSLRIGIWIEGTQEFEYAPFVFFVTSANLSQDSLQFLFIDPPDSLSFSQAVANLDAHNPVYKHDFDAYVFITSTTIEGNLFWQSYGPIIKITTHSWNAELSPPSLFEFLFHSMLCGILIGKCNDLDSHYEFTMGCQFDYTRLKEMDKVDIALGYICKEHKKIISKDFSDKFLLDIEDLFKYRWLGKIDDAESVRYKLKDVFGVDLSTDSGFKKSFWERIQPNLDTMWFDFAKEIVKGVILIAIAYIVFKLGLKP